MIPDYYIIPGAVIAVLVLLALAFWARYKTVGPDRAMIVTGSFLGSKNASIDESGRQDQNRPRRRRVYSSHFPEGRIPFAALA